MTTIYKYPFATTDEFALKMPGGAEILSVQVQNGTPCIWAKVDPREPNEDRAFRVFGTGHPIEDAVNAFLDYVGTYQLSGGSLVFHLFENLA